MSLRKQFVFLGISIASFGGFVLLASAAWVDAPNSAPNYGTGPCTYPCEQADFQPVNLGPTTQTKAGTFGANEFCLGGSCITSWPSGAGGTITGSGSSGLMSFWDSASSLSSNANFVWDNTNTRLGIGVTTPDTKLEVQGSGADADVRVTGPDPRVSLNSNTAGTGRLWYLQTQGFNGSFRIYDDTANQERLTMLPSGYTGLGMSAPGHMFHIATSSGETVLGLQNQSVGGRLWQIYSTGSANTEGAGNFMIRDNTAGEVRMLVDTSGNIGIGTPNPTQGLHLYDASGVTGRTNLLLQATTENAYLNFRADGAGVNEDATLVKMNSGLLKLNNIGSSVDNHLVIDTVGNVGIGMTPGGSYELDVNGDINGTQLCIGGVCQSSWPAASANNYTDSISFSGAGTKTLTLSRIGLTPSLTASFTDNDTTYSNGDGLTLTGTAFAVDSTVCRTTGNCPAGAAPAWSSITGIPGDIADGDQVGITSGESLKIIRGSLDIAAASGAIVAQYGTGFTVTRVSQGRFDVAFSTAFSSLPSVVASHTSCQFCLSPLVYITSPSSFQIRMYTNASAAIDGSFSFIAAGNP